MEGALRWAELSVEEVYLGGPTGSRPAYCHCMTGKPGTWTRTNEEVIVKYIWNIHRDTDLISDGEYLFDHHLALRLDSVIVKGDSHISRLVRERIPFRRFDIEGEMVYVLRSPELVTPPLVVGEGARIHLPGGPGIPGVIPQRDGLKPAIPTEIRIDNWPTANAYRLCAVCKGADGSLVLLRSDYIGLFNVFNLFFGGPLDTIRIETVDGEPIGAVMPMRIEASEKLGIRAYIEGLLA